ncbi:uncharacterized protein LOC112568989 isoform X1 [Pomacea canaliculata]|uniref:uncharacterized protein LOC112568989 isoform X1 n=1 Tax=Pomacea canaliculata TaxID=400727 RepID=UPI000D73FFF8|nr:uncharacterized protein LOC112568989 isoform X1 [Pomacea canaliculata]
MDDLQVRLSVLLLTLCSVQGIVINNCHNNNLEIFEDTPVAVTCGDFNSNVDVTWQANSSDIGVCTSDGRCTARTDYKLSRQPKSTESHLTIVSNYRAHAGLIVSCLESRTGFTVSCTIVIKRHSVLTGCHVNFNNVTGLVSGSCGVQEAYSSDDKYSCIWTVNSKVIPTLYLKKPFYNCSFTQPGQGTGFYNYTILVNPPSTTGFSQSLVIVDTVTEVTVTDVTVNSPSSLSTDTGVTDVVFSTSAIQSTQGTHDGSTVSQEGDAWSLLTSTTEMIIIGGAAAGVAVIIFLLLIIYFVRRKKQSHEGQTECKGSAQHNLDDFEDHINEVYESVSKDVQKISHKEAHERVEEECQYYSNTNNVYYNKNNLYCTKQSASPHQTQARPPGKTVNKVCEHRLSMEPFCLQDSSHHGLKDEKDCGRRPKNVRDKKQT